MPSAHCVPSTTPESHEMTSPRTATRNRVIVGVDGSDSSKQALRWGAFLARATACTVEAVWAWEPFSALGYLGAGWAAMPADWDPSADAEKMLTATIDEVFGSHRPEGLVLTVREGNPASILLEASRQASSLVVGSRGHGGFVGLLLGSVSAACSEHATCPVLVLHGAALPPD